MSHRGDPDKDELIRRLGVVLFVVAIFILIVVIITVG